MRCGLHHPSSEKLSPPGVDAVQRMDRAQPRIVGWARVQRRVAPLGRGPGGEGRPLAKSQANVSLTLPVA
jgi:hypothetical protein